MNLKEYWRQNFHLSGYGITKIACHAIGMNWPPQKGWLKHKGHIEMTPELIEIFERHIPEGFMTDRKDKAAKGIKWN